MKKPFIISAIIVIALLSQSSTIRAILSPEKHIIKSDNLDEKTLIAQQFDSETGAHIALEQLIKQYLPNPDSYQHISSSYTQIEDQLSVTTKYSSIRDQGQRVEADALVIYHLNGRLINLLKVD